MNLTSHHNASNQAEFFIESKGSSEEKNRFLALLKRVGKAITTNYSLLLASSITVTLSIGFIYSVLKKPENDLSNRISRQLEGLCPKCRTETVSLICGQKIRVNVSDTKELAEIVVECIDGSSSPLDKLRNRVRQIVSGDPGPAPDREYKSALVRDAIRQSSANCKECSEKLASPLDRRYSSPKK